MKRSRNIAGAITILILAGAAAALLRFLLGPGEELQMQATRDEEEDREGQRRVG